MFFLEVLLIIDWSGSAFSVYTDTETWSKLGKENALLILNHSNELDWLVAWVLGNQSNILGVSACSLLSVPTLNQLFSFHVELKIVY